MLFEEQWAAGKSMMTGFAIHKAKVCSRCGMPAVSFVHDEVSITYMRKIEGEWVCGACVPPNEGDGDLFRKFAAKRKEKQLG